MNTQEQNIHIAGSFEEDKIKMIRQLMEEEAIAFNDWVLDSSYRVLPFSISDLWFNDIEFKKGTGIEQDITYKQLYELYQKSKPNDN